VAGIYPALFRARPGAVRVRPVAAVFYDIGTVADYLATSLALAREEGTGARLVGARSVVAPDAQIVRSVLWDDVHVAARCVLEDTVVADGVTLPAGLHVRGCSVVPATAAPPGPGDRLIGGALVCPFAHEGARA
jgi:NDP-sugar pyrophosphorylase family protein